MEETPTSNSIHAHKNISAPRECALTPNRQPVLGISALLQFRRQRKITRQRLAGTNQYMASEIGPRHPTEMIQENREMRLPNTRKDRVMHHDGFGHQIDSKFDLVGVEHLRACQHLVPLLSH
jgi:hypothetical protein